MLTAHLKRVYGLEHKEFEDAAARYIAEAAEGSVRDCLSIADMCLNYSDGKLLFADVLEVLGAADRNNVGALFTAVAAGDVGASLRQIDALARFGKSMSLIAKELVRYARDLLVLKNAGDALVADSAENIEKMRAAAAGYSTELLVGVIRVFSAIDADLRYAVSPKIILETAAVRACILETDDVSVLAERVRRLEQALAGGAKIPVAQPGAAASANAPAAESAPKPGDAKSVWGRLTTYFRQAGNMNMYTLVGEHGDYEIAGNLLVIYADDESFFRFSEPAAVGALGEALRADGLELEVRVQKRASDADMDGEIDNLKRLAGKAKLNIIK
jgi:DNA polymerase III gamma/tau subunit